MSNIDYSKIKPQPYESFDEADNRREAEATSVYPPLTEAQKREVARQSGINPVTQLVEDTVDINPEYPQARDLD